MALLFKSIKKSFSFNYPCPRKLREIMQMSLVEREPPHQVKFLWEEYHSKKQDNVAMVF